MAERGGRTGGKEAGQGGGKCHEKQEIRPRIVNVLGKYIGFNGMPLLPSRDAV